jgi:hypothetical protein
MYPVEGDIDEVEFKVYPSNAGEFDGNVFKPSKAGEVKITAYAGDAQGEVELQILDKPVSLKFSTNNLYLDLSETYNLGNIIGIDKNGDSATIPSNYITYSYRNKIGSIEDGIFTAGTSNNTGAITATFGDALTNIQVKVGYRYKTLNRFEDLDDLKLELYPENSEGSIEISDKYYKEGHNSLKLNYDFTKLTDQSISSIKFGEHGEGVVLEDNPEAIGMWVYGDGKEHWLRCRIQDVYGTEIKLTFADKVDWTGWKWVTADIPVDISYPIKLNSIYLAEINEDKTDSGSIYVDNLRLMYEPNDKNLGLRQETVFVDDLHVSEIKNYSELLTITPTSEEVVDSNQKELSDGNIVYYDGIISNGTMSAWNTTMWNNIKSFVNYENKVLVLTMNESLDNINDERELEILKSILKESSENNQVFVVWKGDSESVFVEDGIRYIVYDDSLEIGIYEDEISYKN